MRFRAFPPWSVAMVVAGALGCAKTRSTGDPPSVADAPSCATVGRARPDKARYRPGDPIAISVDVTNTTDRACSTTLALSLTHLGDPAAIDAPAPATINIDAGGTMQARFTFAAPAPDFQGYLASIALPGASSGATTGIDVSSVATRFPRYGFVSEFPPGQSRDRSAAIIQRLTQDLHLNLIQFYDWGWRHEKLIERNADGSIVDPWNDLFGRMDSWATIRDLIDAAHEQNALAMAYATVYAAREGYHELWGIPVGWALFDTMEAKTQVSLSFGSGVFLFLFDPSNPGWQQWMLTEYKSAINAGKFDGIQLDQFGPRPTPYRADGSAVDLPAAFVSFLDAIKPGLVANDPAHAVCAFNVVDGAVDGPGVREVAPSNTCDILYSELWYTADTYESVREYVNQLRELGGGRAVVLAAYSNYGEDIGTVLEAEDATLSGCYVANDHDGYSGRGFVAGFDQEGDAIKWNVTLPEAGDVSLVFRYANATGFDAVRTAYVDGMPVAKLRMRARPTWSDWSSDAWVQVTESARAHTVELRFDPGDVGTVNIDRLTLSQFNESSVRLENAVIFSSGATHIELGDDLQALSTEYFPNHSKSLSGALVGALEHQYDFITAYENLLFESDVVAHDERRGAIVVRSGQQIVTTGAGGIWSAVREKGPYEMIHLVNLIGVDDDKWRNGAPTPQAQQNVSLRYYGPRVEQAQSAFYATPDDETGAPYELILAHGADSRGPYVEFVVPKLEYWDLVVLREPR
jgi:hypothetical protein